MALPSKDTLRLIQWLAERKPAELLALARARGLTPANTSSLTAMAVQLVDDASIRQAVNSLSRSALVALASKDIDINEPGVAELDELGLLDTRTQPPLHLTTPAQRAVVDQVDFAAASPTVSPAPALDAETLAKHATMVAGVLFELGDLVDALARHPQPVTKHRALSVTGLKSLTDILGEGYDLPTLVELGFLAGLLTSDGSSMRVTPAAVVWREGSSEDQWRLVSTAWWRHLPSWLHRIITDYPEANWDTDLPGLVSYSYPLLDATDVLNQARHHSATLGVTARGWPTPWGSSLWSAGSPMSLGASLPAPVAGVYATEDFTLLAPGPLALEHRLILDRIAHRELGGLIPRYRLTTRSVLRALHQGINPADVLDLLQRTSQTPLPDGMVHLIEDTCRLAGNIELSRTRNGTTITVNRLALVAELLADPSLGPLSLRQLDQNSLSTKLPVERVHDILLGSRYLALIAGEEELYPAPEVTTGDEEPRSDPLAAAIATLSAAIDSAAGHGVPPWLGSVLEVAIANKIALEISVEMPGGESVTLVMEPRSVGGGRLRGVEIKNSMEKTIPISAIRGASPWSPPAN
jgi:hypothetical protein